MVISWNEHKEMDSPYDNWSDNFTTWFDGYS